MKMLETRGKLTLRNVDTKWLVYYRSPHPDDLLPCCSSSKTEIPLGICLMLNDNMVAQSVRRSQRVASDLPRETGAPWKKGDYGWWDDEWRYSSSNFVSTFPPAARLSAAPALITTVTRGPDEGSSHGERSFLRRLCLVPYTGFCVFENNKSKLRNSHLVLN